MEKEITKKSSKSTNSIFAIVAVVCGLACLVILLVILLRGETTISGTYPDDVSDESLVCSAEGVSYPFFRYDNSIGKKAEVRLIFSHDSLSSISLMYSLYYNDATSITGSEAHNHAAMNESFSASGLGVSDAYNAKYARMEDRMQMNLYVTRKDFDEVARKYFFATGYAETVSDYKSLYENQGFRCKIVDN